jgi:RNA polymerase sigma-70 factor (ECF subfamily)
MSDIEATSRTSDGSALADWLAGVARGDRAAFESLYRATSARLFGICLRVLHDRDEAEDVLQDVFTTVWNKAVQYDPERASAPAWLAMIARNKAIDRVRARPLAMAAGADEADDVPDPAASPLHDAEAATERRRLDGCLDELEPQRRTLIRAAFFDGCTYEELARRGGSPLGSVKSWIRRGLQQLRTCLER